MGSTEDDINQTEVLVNECITVLNNEEDTEFVNLAVSGTTSDIWNRNLMLVSKQIKDAIQGLTQTYEAEAKKIQESSSAIKSEELQHLAEEKAAAENYQKEIKQDVDSLKEEIVECKKETEEIQQKYNKVKEDTTQELPSLRYEVNLYSLITNIRWQYDVDPDDIRGYICNKSNVQPFQMNSKQNSHFFIANYLWDLMDHE